MSAALDRRALWRAYLALWALTVAAAVLVLLAPGAGAYARNMLGFTLAPQRVDLPDAIRVWLTNARFIALLTTTALLACRHRALRFVCDVVVGWAICSNVALVGIALGAYGARAPRWLVHVPLEWAAIAAALALYLRARRRAPNAHELALTLLTAGAVLVAAALLETFATPHR
jgi:hypothetical protein